MKNHNLRGGLNFTGKKSMPLTPSESAVSKSIEGFLNARKIKNYRLNSGKIRKKGANGKDYWILLLPVGCPDRVFFVNGFAYFIEVKMKGKLPTAEQLAEHQDLRERGGCVVIIADSLESFIEQFNELFPDRSEKVYLR